MGPWAMVPDVIEVDQEQTGERREGSYYAFASFFQKLATGAAIWALGMALAWANYVTPVAGDALPVQTPEAVGAIRIFMGPVPAVLILLAIVFAWKFNITRESHQARLERIANMNH